MIVVKGEPQTAKIKKCQYNPSTKRCDVTYKNGKTYPYAYYNVRELTQSGTISQDEYVFYHDDFIVSADSEITYFIDSNGGRKYYRFKNLNGYFSEFAESELKIERTAIKDKKGKDILSYLKDVAGINTLANDKGEKLLAKTYSRITMIPEKTVLGSYINGTTGPSGLDATNPIFPFGCNSSQYDAVCNALNNKISVIQGPPGTGKTQTILNIIANLVIRGKTVQIVSNNNSATDNVYEKLCANGLGFIAAPLGSADNKEDFIQEQSGRYPNLKGWLCSGDIKDLFEKLAKCSERSRAYYKDCEEEARLAQEKACIEVEYEHFKLHLKENNRDLPSIAIKKSIKAISILTLIREVEDIIDDDKNIGWIRSLVFFFKYGIKAQEIKSVEPGILIDKLQTEYYTRRLAEIGTRREELSKSINRNVKAPQELASRSMEYFKDYIVRKYGESGKRKVFSDDDLWKNAKEFVKEYPVILSTTFSSKNTLGSYVTPVTYDYVIMDESSQVDLATGALAMYSANNAVIVGDNMQLPNVLSEPDKIMAQSIFACYDIPDGYRFTHSFLDSIMSVIEDLPCVLLKEHYRCHPKIIEFCNQKFYKGQLVIMTKDNGEQNVINAYTTVIGNHARGHRNQRQIDVIKEEILPQLNCPPDELGIITPYRDQVAELRSELPEGIEVDTVHKFQGRERDVIIISTVDNEVNDFSDNPNLINVAVSRAKKKLYIVSSGNETGGNVHDLIEYVRYNNFEVRESKITSIFDYLYSAYSDELRKYLKDKKRISEYDSENLMYALLNEIFDECGWKELEVLCHVSLRNIIRDVSLLSDEEKRYATHPFTHVDFSIVNRVTKEYIMAIEVDGSAFHRGKSIDAQKQAVRDKMKDHIMEIYGIPLKRFPTDGSVEKQALIKELRSRINATN